MKDAARKAAFARRKTADRSVEAAANAYLLNAVSKAEGACVSAYWPIRTEIDPRPTLHALAKTHRLCLPVVQGDGQPLTFRRWTPSTVMEIGAFGAGIPAEDLTETPDILIVPLAAFDARGYRLGYGGGFYDRTLEVLRARGSVTAIGFAFDVQETANLPVETTDQPLDMIVTESGMRAF